MVFYNFKKTEILFTHEKIKSWKGLDLLISYNIFY